ncbi:MAG TPA: multicopper oxidase domain-containing protein [Kofleriaceae bacterium]|nr:multicopper oxidase domain-containing protein [Kofleriaceae bacterium]
MRFTPSLLALTAALLLAPAGAAAQPVTVTLRASRDAGIMAEDGTLANGAGASFHVGVTNNGDERRALIRFNVGSIPAGATIQSARVRLYMSRSSPGAAVDVELHRITRSWSEGPADPTQGEGQGAPASAGDVTWTHAVYDTSLWTTPGGDVAAAASATESIATATGPYTWTSATLASDVQAWIDGSAANEGWMLIAPGAGTAEARRFEARESSDSARRPALIVTFTTPDPTGACCAGDGSCTVVSSPGTGCAGDYQGDDTDCTPNPCPQPQGACCLPDASATCELVTAAQCAADGGSYQGDDTACDSAMCPVVLAPFADPLPIPPVAQPVTGSPGGEAEYAISAVEFEQRLHRDLPPSRVWGWDDGTSGPVYPGPTIEAWRDRPVRVTWRNDIRGPDGVPRTSHYLPVDECVEGVGDAARTVVHLHGGHVAAESDGYPEDAYPPGEELTYDYPNWQPAATLWYHDHALGITRLNVYLGLAGIYTVRDDAEAGRGLPSGEYDIPLVIQDRSFNPDGTLQYPAMWMEHFFGNTILVNGRVWPYLAVDRGKYRFRVLNGSNARFYRLALADDSAFQVVGTDTGRLAAPVTVASILLAPGERAELVIDFAGYDPGTRVRLVNSAPAPFPGTPGEGVVPNVMQFRIGDAAGHTGAIDDTPADIGSLDPSDAAEERDFELARVDDDCGGARWLINGKEWDEVSEQPRLGTVEIWRFVNRSGFAHPMHMHLVSFRLLDRQEFAVLDGEIQPLGDPVPPAPEEDGWKDTVLVAPNQMVRVIARFEDFAGRFPYHCHMLEHEDHMMMRQFETVTTCGDGAIGRPLEDCDEGGAGETADCDEDCTVPTCGDGLVNEAAGEECDDGRQEDGDGCSADCVVEPDGGGGGDDGCGCRAGSGSGAAVWLVLLALAAATRRRRAASSAVRSGGPAGP